MTAEAIMPFILQLPKSEQDRVHAMMQIPEAVKEQSEIMSDAECTANLILYFNRIKRKNEATTLNNTKIR